MDPDWGLIEKFFQGDRGAFESLFHRHKEGLIRLSFRFVKQRQAAEDIAQEVFIKVYEKKVKIDTRSKFSTWLYRVTVNASLDWVRRRKFLAFSLDRASEDAEHGGDKLPEGLADPKSSSLRETLDTQELRKKVQDAIDQLPEKLKTPLLLYQFEQFSYQEIARILGLSEKAVERRLYHAREALRKIL